ncbi:hypothetical protein UCMB321_1524 [Pseudomonas batumici]|uniref:Uncharacterized protein n=1 Tax=Pseudomonas batumici TaxID=226910 RepID=A0A0C2EFL7_9PSED|nr:hypothetical protein UCMB321_1524 [Pseudomonas batumici]
MHNGGARARLQDIEAHGVSPGGLPVGIRLFLLSGTACLKQRGTISRG